VGAWLHTNGEAIYGTRPWQRFGEGPTEVASGAFQDAKTKPFTAADFRFTTKPSSKDSTKGSTIYAIELGWPAEGQVTVRSLGGDALAKLGSKLKVTDVRLLGSTATVKWQQRADGLALTLPKDKPGKYAYAFRVTLR
jgi:alpha-L-fucosidase